MEFTFEINNEGLSFIQQNKSDLYSIVMVDEEKSSVTLDLYKPNKCTPGQFMSEVKKLGLLVGKRDGNFIVLESHMISKYPYELEPL